MAKVVGPLNSSEARGSVGALTYNTWRGISTVKTRTGPTIQYSPDQVDIRAKTKLCTIRWQSLTAEQRAMWYDYANDHTDIDWSGNPKRLTAYNWFVRLNVRALLWGAIIKNTPPPPIDHLYLSGITPFSYQGAIYIAWAEVTFPGKQNWKVELYLTGPHSGGAFPTVKMADRCAMASYTDYYVEGPLSPDGWYTAYLRPLEWHGIVDTFQSVRFYHPVPEGLALIPKLPPGLQTIISTLPD